MNTEPWKGEDWWVSPLNFAEDVRKELTLPNRVEFHDVTLRDGEQTPGVVFRKEEKVAIAKMLDEVGIHRIEAGMPVVSKEDADAVKAIAREGLKAKVMGFSRLVREDLDAVLKCDVSGVICEGPVGEPKLKQFDWTEADVLSKAIDTIDYAKSHGLYTVFFGVDTTRANPKFLLDFIERISSQTKVDAIALVDTFGCSTPDAIKFLVQQVARVTKLPLEIHCHNDFGLGTACTLAAVSAGAQVVHTSVNGIGERTGNVSFEEVAISLQLLYGLKLSLNFDKFFQLSGLVEKLSGFTVPTNKPVIGERAFTREAGIAVAGWMKYYLGSEAFLPEFVGNRHAVLLGKKSGRHSVEWKLKELRVSATSEQVQEILRQVKELSEAKKSAVTDEELSRILTSVGLHQTSSS